MKRKSIFLLSAVILCVSVLFTGCDFAIQLPGAPEDVSQVGLSAPVTRVVEVTDTNGNVVGTENVTLSEQEIKDGQDFYSALDDSGVLSGISGDRYDDATSSGAQNEKNIFESRNYYVVGRIVKDGKTSTYKLAQSGSKYAVMTVYNGHQIGIIIDSINIYLVQIENKSYMAIPKTLLLEYNDDDIKSLLDDDLLDSDKKIVKNGTTKVDGMQVSYSKYDDGSVSYYKDNTILMSKSADGTIIYYDTVNDSAPSGFFAPPAGYTLKALNAENVNEFSNIIGGTVVE